MTYAQLIDEFIGIYGGSKDSIRIFEAPGRVNLIGEHTDYNGGYVFPAALCMSNIVVARVNNTNNINLAATSIGDRVSGDISNLEQHKKLSWGNYQLGVAYVLKNAGYRICGCDMLYHGTVPFGAGLSSSASIEVATAIALAKLGGRETINPVEIALLSQKAENEYVGMNCGIMDQFISAVGKAENAILLNCNTLEYQYVPVKLGQYKLVIVNTNKPRKLVESKYNERRAECTAALRVINDNGGHYRYLCDMTMDDFKVYEKHLTNENERKRARHAVSENARTLKAVDALRSGRIQEFGTLLNQSHESLRYDYEVTGVELDTLFDEAVRIEGVVGARMTGAGFGGCLISLVEECAVNEFEQRLKVAYTHRIGYAPSFYVTDIGDGGREIVDF